MEWCSLKRYVVVCEFQKVWRRPPWSSVFFRRVFQRPIIKILQQVIWKNVLVDGCSSARCPTLHFLPLAIKQVGWSEMARRHKETHGGEGKKEHNIQVKFCEGVFSMSVWRCWCFTSSKYKQNCVMRKVWKSILVIGSPQILLSNRRLGCWLEIKKAWQRRKCETSWLSVCGWPD